METKFKLGRDANGNKTLYVKTGAKRAKTIQTNGNLPKTHSDGVGEWTAGEVAAHRKALTRL
jgi:hypothetical protein